MMGTKGKKSPTQKHLDKLRASARKEISIAGTVQFRVDEEAMLLLMKAADQNKLPLGTLVQLIEVRLAQGEKLYFEDNRKKEKAELLLI